ncbi:hypothetical protein EPN96_01390 [bacterium]|nr:MAG: hypothetical protein EPN96_01390 [bacterium]
MALKARSLQKKSGLSGKASPTLVVAVAAALLGAIVVMNLFIKEKPPERYPLSSAKEALSVLGKPRAKAEVPPAAPAPEAKPSVEPAKAAAEAVRPVTPPAPVKPPEPAPAKVATAAVPKEAPAPKPAPAAPAVKPPPPAKEAAKPLAVGGDYVVHAGIFRSQFYLISLEERLKAMGIPYFREKVMRKGDGFRLSVVGADASKAKDILAASGYDAELGQGRVDSYFFLDKEWEKAKSALSAKGINATVEKFTGDVPIWRLYCGPFSEGDAGLVLARLKEKNIDDAKITRRAR